jgi:hypothetical protein
MCICAAPGNFSATKVYAGEGTYDSKYVHTIAYQNNAESQNRYEPNAMILPFPTNVPMSRANVVNTSSFKGFLQDIADATKIHSRSLGKSMAFSAGVAGGVDVFDSGSYTVILADNIKLVPGAMSSVDDEKRIALSYRFLMGFNKLYADQPVAVCLWKGSVEAEPLLWWYEPKDKGTLFVPTMDAHDGNGPDLEANVDTDHIISVGSNQLDDSRRYNRVHYKTPLTGVAKGLLPTYVYGTELPGTMKNGDMFFKVADLKQLGDKLNYPTIKRGVSYDSAHTSMNMFGWHA